MTNVKKNFLYNVLYQILNLLIPFITIPYVSRALGVQANGIYSYTYSVVNYFMIFGMLGISNYGNRKIAKCRENKEVLSKEFISIYLLQCILTLTSFVVYIFYILFINQYKLISIVEGIFIISTLLDISWFYFGLEEFKLTVIRGISIKLFSLIFIILYVKNENHLYLYTFIMAISAVISQIVLWIGLKKHVNLSLNNIRKEDIFKHIKGAIILFIPVISYSIYKIMSKILLGMLSSVEEVAYYEYAEKIINVPIALVTALGTVMLPKISNLISKQNFSEANKYLFKSLKFIMFIAIPSSFGLIAIGKEFSIVFLGEEYAKTGILIGYLAITIVFTAWANVIRTQWLIPKEYDKIYINTTIIGAVFNLIINIFLIPKYGSIGACIATLCSEFIIMFLQSFLSRKEVEFFKIVKQIIYLVFTAFVMFLIIRMINYIEMGNIYKIVLKCILGAAIYLILNFKYVKKEILNK